MTVTKASPLLAFAAAAFAMLLSNTAFATWTVYEYPTSDGYRYGIKDGGSQVKLDLKSRKQARKTAKAMNKADKVDEKAEK